jgi:uncharacterized protein
MPPDMNVHVTMLYAGLTGLLLVFLGANVSRLRGKYKLGVSSEPPPPELHSAIRAHGNAAEWAPLGFLLLLLLELSGLGALPLHVLGGGLLLGRLAHAFGLLGGPKGLGTAGAALTYGFTGTLAGWLVVRHFVG